MNMQTRNVYVLHQGWAINLARGPFWLGPIGVCQWLEAIGAWAINLARGPLPRLAEGRTFLVK